MRAEHSLVTGCGAVTPLKCVFVPIRMHVLQRNGVCVRALNSILRPRKITILGWVELVPVGRAVHKRTTVGV